MWLLRGGGTAGMGTILLQCQAGALILQYPGDGVWCERGVTGRAPHTTAGTRERLPGHISRLQRFFLLFGSPELSHGRSRAQRMQLLEAHKQHPAWGPH